MSSAKAKIILSPGKDVSLKRKHPWVFSGAIKKTEGTPNDGEIVSVYSSKDEFLGIGHYHNGSISVRIFHFENEIIDLNFWKKKLTNAIDYRKSLNILTKNTNTYRLIFGEGDGFPGLIVDVYDTVAIYQAHTIGMHLLRNDLSKLIVELFDGAITTIYDKSKETLPQNYANTISNSYLVGPTNNGTTVLENDIKFFIDWEGGQKTGFFVDQRENRQLLKKYSQNKTVLNTFCYTGGFSLYSLLGGALKVHSVDSSKKAIELTNKNIELNNSPSTKIGEKHEAFVSDTFAFLKDKHNIYDLIILDPPAFAKHQNVKHNAINGYKRLNAEAISRIKPGGIIFTFSCSQVIDKKTFYGAVMAAAIEVGRNIKVMHQLSQPADHPVNVFHPEGEYLKGLVLFVE